MCVLVYTDSALQNADADPGEEGSDDASVLEGRGTALTVASLRERCSVGVGRDQKRSGLMWMPTRVQLADGRTKSSAGVFLRNALTSGTACSTRRVRKSRGRNNSANTLKAYMDVNHIKPERWVSPLVDAGWYAFCQALYKGIEGEDWEEMVDSYKAMSKALGCKKS